MSYDQWKTASPYDDEPDYADESIKMAEKIEQYIASADLKDDWPLTVLLKQSADTHREVADWICDN
jgi:hypothetical protein